MPERIAATFIGSLDDNGYPVNHLEGIPARDLTESEFEALPDDLKLALAANAASKDRAIYRLKPTEREAVAEIVQADQPAAKPAPPVASRIPQTTNAAPVDAAPSAE